MTWVEDAVGAVVGLTGAGVFTAVVGAAADGVDPVEGIELVGVVVAGAHEASTMEAITTAVNTSEGLPNTLCISTFSLYITY